MPSRGCDKECTARNDCWPSPKAHSSFWLTGAGGRLASSLSATLMTRMIPDSVRRYTGSRWSISTVTGRAIVERQIYKARGEAVDTNGSSWSRCTIELELPCYTFRMSRHALTAEAQATD